MVSYNPKVWFSLIFHAYSRNIMKTLMPALIFLTLYTGACCFVLLAILRFHESDFKTTIAMHSLLGIVLGLFLVFRTNSAYDRWWEGRRIWGSFVNNARNLALKINSLVGEGRVDEKKWFSLMIPAFVHAVKDHLRKGAKLEELDLPESEKSKLSAFKHIPNGIISMMYDRISRLHQEKVIDGDQLILVDKEIKEFTDILGGCERIKNTPIPYSYSMFIKKFIFIYLVTLPFAFVTTSGYLTIPIVVIITYVLLSVELIAEEIEDPFGGDVNDLPTDELTIKIRENVREILLGPQPVTTL